MKSFGIEEEFFLVHRDTGMPAVPEQNFLSNLSVGGAGGNSIQPELLACQVETATPICFDGPTALASLREFRQHLSTAALEAGIMAVSLGTLPQHPPEPAVVTDGARYQKIGIDLPGISGDQYVSGLHIHVGIPDYEAQVVALNALREWLPLINALGTNSPFWRSIDTGFSSWRNIHYRRWSVQGIPPFFADAKDYQDRVAAVVAAETVSDDGYIGWAARVSSHYPTVEVRVPDAQLRADESVLLALIVRAIVDTSLRQPKKRDHLRPELLDIALWQGAKHGMSGDHVDPSTGQSISVENQVRKLLDFIDRVLVENGDTEFVHTGLTRWAQTGNGAQRQRQSYRQGGLLAVTADASKELTA